MASLPWDIPLDDIPNMSDILIHTHDVIAMAPNHTSHDSSHVVETAPSLLNGYTFANNNSWIFDDEEAPTTLDDTIPFPKDLPPPSSIIYDSPHELDRIPPHMHSIQQVLLDYQ